jgi:hypothetical protein
MNGMSRRVERHEQERMAGLLGERWTREASNCQRGEAERKRLRCLNSSYAAF